MTDSTNTALVTGAAGFIGSHLVDFLLAAGWRVRGLDDFSAGSGENLAAVAGHPDFELIEGSVLDTAATRRATAGTTHVFHLAARLGAEYVEAHPDETMLHTIEATRSILTVVADARLPLFFASTSEIYGDSAKQPLSESDDIAMPPPANPRSCYALGKGVAEVMVCSHIREGRGAAVIGRLFNTIGPRQSPAYGHVVPRFIDRALSSEPLVIQGSGEQTRSFTAVRDVVEAIVAVLTTPAAHGLTINIGGSAEVSITDLARLVLRLSGSTSELRYEPYEEAHGRGARDIRRRVPDTELLASTVNKRCDTPLEVAMAEILAHARVRRGSRVG
jgi:UDP-glucose 4-epimerase